MTNNTRNRLLGAAALVALVAPVGAQAQTIVNLSNFDTNTVGSYVNTSQSGLLVGSPTIYANTALDLANQSVALTTGGVFGAAINNQLQQGGNLLNAMGINPNTGAIEPVVLGNAAGAVSGSGANVQINTITSAYYQSGTQLTSAGSVSGSNTYAPNVNGTSSLTIFNNNIAGNQGANQLFNPFGPSAWLGASSGGAQAGGSQFATNNANAVGAAFADGTNVSLNQLAAGPQLPSTGLGVTSTITQGNALNMSGVNSMVAATLGGPAVVDAGTVGSDGKVVNGNQLATNAFNTASLYGAVNLGVNQKADGLDRYSNFTAANQALAYSANLVGAAVDPSVSNLNQTASSTINALTLGSSNSTTAGTTLSGLQSVGNNPNGGTPMFVQSNQITASTVGVGNTFNPGVSVISLGSFIPGTGTPGSPVYPSIGNASTGPVSVSNVGQQNVTSFNSLNAGTNPITTSGPSGFVQSVGTVNLVGSNSTGAGATGAANVAGPAVAASIYGAAGEGLPGNNGIYAQTLAGRASISDAQQNYGLGMNTFNSGANISGSVTQGIGQAVFSGTTVGNAPVAGTTGYDQFQQGIGGSVLGPYFGPKVSGNAYTNSNFNTASAYTQAGVATLNNVKQGSSIVGNVLSTTGTIDSTSAGIITQNAGAISVSRSTAGYEGGGGVSPQNNAVATVGFNGYVGNGSLRYPPAPGGTASITSLAQTSSAALNQISAPTVSGSIGQTSGNIGSYDGFHTYGGSLGNNAVAQNFQLGNAQVGGSQANFASLNNLTVLKPASGPASSLGSAATSTSAANPIGVTQVSTGVGGTTDPTCGTSGCLSPLNVSNSSLALGGANGGATSAVLQQAGFQQNNITSPGGTFGSLAQAANGVQVQTSNLADAQTGGGYGTTNGVGGNAMVQTAQGGFNSLNTAALGGTINGNIQQVTYKPTFFGVANVGQALASAGSAVSYGQQVGQNSVNVITSK